MDLELVENGNGGDLVKTPRDLSVIEGFENMPYLAICGGNLKASTAKRLPTEQAFDWWANSFMDPELQMNSETERVLNNVALNSSGRTAIEEAVKKDLGFMTKFALINVVVSIVATDKVVIGLRITKPNNIQKQDFIYIWDATNKELIDREVAISRVNSNGGGGVFDFTFDLTFDT